MAGLSRRFREAGYALPKYMLPLAAGTCFDYALASFEHCFAEEFIFVVRDEASTADFVRRRCERLALKFTVIELTAPTAGQADTVEIGINAAQVGSEQAITIFNIDTFRPGYRPPGPASQGDGFLEVFEGEGSNWSFVEPRRSGGCGVLRTTEKDPISRLCCTGLYFFRTAGDFRWALARERTGPDRRLGELYVAPIYNHLIKAGRDIRFSLIDGSAVAFCGVPEEYVKLRDNPRSLPSLPGDGGTLRGRGL